MGASECHYLLQSFATKRTIQLAHQADIIRLAYQLLHTMIS